MKKNKTLLLFLLANGYSREQIKSTLKKLHLPYDENALNFLSQSIYDDLKVFKNRPLKYTYFAVFINA